MTEPPSLIKFGDGLICVAINNPGSTIGKVLQTEIAAVQELSSLLSGGSRQAVLVSP